MDRTTLHGVGTLEIENGIAVTMIGSPPVRLSFQPER